MLHNKISFYLIKVTILILVFIFCSTFNFTLKANAQKEIEVFGYYYLEEKAIKIFPEIDHIHLSNIDDKGNKAPVSGLIRPKKQKALDYKFIKISLEGRNLSFTTKTIQGIHYEFSGKFLTDSPSESSGDDIVLKGNLKKFQGEKVTAQENVNLTYFTGD